MDDGKQYPLMKLDVTSESHPFYTGAQQRVSETGRVEKFRQKFARTKSGT
jgi:large subunit ribosomal protein L31